MRKDSETYGQWIGEELSEDNRKIFFLPKGVAHGFLALTDNCKVQYSMSEFYHPEYSSGVRWNDPFFNIVWPIKFPTLSEKDEHWPLIKSK